ncbi:MAG: hypothetical protein BYD32DRAFT_425697 [Podila humilis]|nr:MAG: hypothetical protein BYD32DRAFT_425697 [Podila humilis]
MALFATVTGSNNLLSYDLNRSLAYLSAHSSMTLFSLKNVNTSSTQTVFNPEGHPVADIVELTLRSSSIGGQNVHLQFYYDPYNWSFPPDLILRGTSIKPSLTDIGLDNTWDYQDPSNLSKVLGKISRMLQHGERQRVATFENERIQVEYSCLHDHEEMDCCLISSSDGPTKVLFAVPFYIKYTVNGAPKSVKACAKIQFRVSSLMNEVMDALSTVEVLSSFEYHDVLKSIPPIGLRESITEFLERVTQSVVDHLEKIERSRHIKKELMDELIKKFRKNLLECDRVNNSYAAFLIQVPRDGPKPDGVPTAVVTVYATESFPEKYPKITISMPILPAHDTSNVAPPLIMALHRYSPRWNAERIVESIWKQLIEDIPMYHNKLVKATSSWH